MGKRVLDEPLERFLSDKSIDLEFCLTWANENWTKTWDGHDDDVLLEQNYSEADDAALVKDWARYLSHSRYYRLRGATTFNNL